MRAIKQKVWNEAENREQDWGETPYGRVRLVRCTPHFTDFFTDFGKKTPTVLQSILPWVPEAFQTRFPVSFGQVLKSDFAARVFGLRPTKRSTKRSSLSNARKTSDTQGTAVLTMEK